jgi:protein gp37
MKRAWILSRWGQEKYKDLTYKNSNCKVVWNGQIKEASDRVFNWPVIHRKPSVIFVNSMSDVGHPSIRPETFERMFSTMCEADHHIFQVLTKRPDVMAERLGGRRLPAHIWMGASIGMPETLDRLRSLRRIKADVLWLSAEPLLQSLGKFDASGLAWVVGGGESGPRREIRPMKYAAISDLRELCARTSTPFFFKQWGHWAANPLARRFGRTEAREIEARIAGRDRPLADGKGGCTLDGRLWLQMPNAAARIMRGFKPAALLEDFKAAGNGHSDTEIKKIDAQFHESCPVPGKINWSPQQP